MSALPPCGLRVSSRVVLLAERGAGRALRDPAVDWHAGLVIRLWPGAPRRIRGTVLLLVVILIYGTTVHAAQLLISGFDPYPGLPGGLRVYFTALLVLDPLAAVLLARRHRSGVLLAVAVLVSDAVANGVANYAFDTAGGVTAGRVGQAVITLLAIGACAVAPVLWRSASPARHHP